MITVQENSHILWMSEAQQEMFRQNPQPIMWIHRGLYGILPKELIQNTLRYRDDAAKFWNWLPPLGFRWAECSDIKKEEETGIRAI